MGYLIPAALLLAGCRSLPPVLVQKEAAPAEAPPPRASEAAQPPAQEESVVLVGAGDIRLDGPVGRLAAKDGAAAPAAGLREWLRGDIVLGNMETSITTRGKKADKKFTFRSRPEALAVVKAAGFTAFTLANNHVMDYGPKGLADTLKALDERGFVHVGAGPTLAEARKPAFLEIRGVRVGLIGLTSTVPDFMWAKPDRPGTAYSDFDRFPDWIREAKSRCDVLVVAFHGGTELAENPRDLQRAFGRAVVDAGADLVLAHHPHVVQPAEVYQGKVILHSLGNFLFVSPNPRTRWSVLARARITRQGVQSVELLPVDTGWGRLAPASPEGAEAVRLALDRDGALTANPGLLRFLPAGPSGSGSR